MSRSLPLSLLFAAGSVALGGCDALGVSDSCSLPVDNSATYDGGAQVNANAVISTVNSTTQQRTYTFFIAQLTALCVAAPDEGNTVSFKVTTSAGSFAVSAIGEVQPAPGYQPYTLPLTASGTTLQGTIANIGLAQGANYTSDKNGRADIALYVSFPTQGNDTVDRTWLQAHVTKIEVIWHFQRAKGPES